MNSITLTNTAVSANPLILPASRIDYSWKNQVQDFPIPGKFDILTTQFQGWENPGFNLSFLIYVDRPQVFTPTNPNDHLSQEGTYSEAPGYTNYITWEQWNLIVRNSTVNTTLALTIGNTDQAFKSYAHSASGVSSIPIQIVSYSVSIEPNTNVLRIDAQCIESV